MTHHPRWISPRRFWLTHAALVLTFGSLLAVPQLQDKAGAVTTRTEAEGLSHGGACWAVLSFGPLSGGAGRFCNEPNAPLAWTVSAGGGEVVRLHGYRDEVVRGFRVRVDGVATTGTLSGAYSPSTLFFTSATLTAGSHRFEVEWVDSAGAFTLDFFEVAASSGGTPATTTTVAPTTTSTVPPTTTTTTAPPTTTTTIAPPTSVQSSGETSAGVCKIAPADGQAAIGAAIRSCPDGSTVQFPAGAVYHQTDPIEVANRSNLIIDGGGSTFISSAPNTADVRPNWRLVKGRTLTIRNMTVEGNFKLQGPRSLPTVSNIATNQRNSGFAVHGGDGVTITDVTVRDVFGDMVLVVPAEWTPTNANVHSEIPRNVRVIRLSGTRAARQCVAPTAVIGFWLEDSTLRDCWYGGVDFERDAVGEPIRDAHILRNTFDGFNLFAIAGTAPGNTGDTNGIEVRGNKMLTPGDSCISTILFGYYPDDPNQMLKIVIEDNDVKSLGNGITYDHINEGSIRNNRIEKTAPDSLCGPPAPVATKVTNSVGVTVAANTVIGYSS